MAEINYIVRVLGKDLDGTISIENALRGIKGLGHRMSKMIAIKFLKEKNYPYDKKMGELSSEDIAYIEDIILHPEKHGIPNWALNRQKEFETGKTTHKTMNDLDFAIRNDYQRLADIKSYRGLRHVWGLPVRGQKTRSTHRGKGPVVGVIKKENAPKASKQSSGEKGKSNEKKK